MNETQTDKLKNSEPLSMREYRLIATKINCSTETVRTTVLGQNKYESLNAKKIQRAAKIIIANRKKLDAQLNKALTEEEILDSQLTGNQYA